MRLGSAFALAAVAAALLLSPARAGEPAAAGAPAFHVGETTRIFHPATTRNWRGARTQALVVNVWYPADITSPETEHDIGTPGHAVFIGHPQSAGAAIASARTRYPLILLSHGTGGSAESLDWIASALAAEGYVVAGVNHPGNTALEPLTGDGFILWWERATDLSETLDGVLADPELGPRIDPHRVGALGFSIGGYTVLELAGARTDFERFLAFCRGPGADATCHPPEMSQTPGVDQAAAAPEAAASIARSGDSYRDPRVRAVFAIAPAVGEAFDAKGLAGISVPVSIVAGSEDQIAPVATNGGRVSGLRPDFDFALIPGAGHYTFLSPCAPALARSVRMLCVERPGVDRNAAHEAAVLRALAFFRRTL